MPKDSIVLVGLSCTGKSSVGKLVARRLGWTFRDTDELIPSLAGGMSIPEIFAEWGEARFRGLERQAVGIACSTPRSVVATGGGAVLDSGNRAMLSGCGVVYWLDAQPHTVAERLAAANPDEAEGQVRPLLGADPRERAEQLKRERAAYYASVADWVIVTDALTPDEVAEEILRNYGRLRGRLSPEPAMVPELNEPGDEASPHIAGLPRSAPGSAAVVSSSGGSYPIFVGSSILGTLPARLQQIGLSPRKAYVITDGNVERLYAGRVAEPLAEAGIETSTYAIPAGEESKSLDTVTRVYDWLTSQRAERGHLIVALGGGVTGDLAGFVAASYLRGMAYVQVPTTLLAMVDSGIGGKTGVNRPTAKNLVGAFYQPKLVLSDIEVLRTLGARELAEGWAEAIKSALIRDARLFETMEQHADALLRLEPGIASRVIGAVAAIKADVVSQDERESGLRAILNYGHTIGHGLEAATEYGRFLHGEAVAVGMIGAARLSQEMGLLRADEVERQRRLLERFGLPLACPGVDPAAIRAAMALDKKVQDARLRWILLDGIGRAVLRDDVPPEWVDRVIGELTGAARH